MLTARLIFRLDPVTLSHDMSAAIGDRWDMLSGRVLRATQRVGTAGNFELHWVTWP